MIRAIKHFFMGIYYVLRKMRYPLYKRIKNSRNPIITYWWFDDNKAIRNFGDEISADIIRYLFGYELKWAPIDEADLIATGSLLERTQETEITRDLHVWGTGFIRGGESMLGENLIVHAVRGKRTRKRIPDWENKKIPMGDPGILANLVYPESAKTGKIGVIPHYVDLENPIVKRVAENPDYVIINPLQHPRKVAAQISACRLIFSSSLHGMIVSDSYDVPNAHIMLSNKVYGGAYKFKDYCSGVGRTYITVDPETIDTPETIESVLSQYEPIKNKRGKQKRLIKAFPF